LNHVFASDFIEMYCQIKKDEHAAVAAIPSPREFYMYGNV